ncbi:hypothetical protein BGZ83_011033 [Gryganskiella cystojenkinii]|nr:hypothetical protein BGZ83_011033 [Gryganskiella cystojenkinii]
MSQSELTYNRRTPFPAIARDLRQLDMYMFEDQEPVSKSSSKRQKPSISHSDNASDVKPSVHFSPGRFEQ